MSFLVGVMDRAPRKTRRVGAEREWNMADFAALPLSRVAIYLSSALNRPEEPARYEAGTVARHDRGTNRDDNSDG